MSNELSDARLDLFGPLPFDEPHRKAVHQSRREPCEQPLSAGDPRLHQYRLVLLHGPQDVAREPVGVIRLAALGLEEVVAADEAADRALVEDRCLHRGRAHDEHPDAAGDGLRPQRQRHADDRMLGRHIAGDLPGCGEPRHRGGVDDVAVALPQHQRIGGRDAVHDAADVDVDDRVPLVQRQQFGVTAPTDARVVEHQVEPAGTADHLVDHRLHGRRIGDIEACGARLPPRRPRSSARRRRRCRCRRRRRPH